MSASSRVATFVAHGFQRRAEDFSGHYGVRRLQRIAQRLQIVLAELLINQSRRARGHPASSKRVTTLRQRRRAEVSQTASPLRVIGEPLIGFAGAGRSAGARRIGIGFDNPVAPALLGMVKSRVDALEQ